MKYNIITVLPLSILGVWAYKNTCLYQKTSGTDTHHVQREREREKKKKWLILLESGYVYTSHLQELLSLILQTFLYFERNTTPD